MSYELWAVSCEPEDRSARSRSGYCCARLATLARPAGEEAGETPTPPRQKALLKSSGTRPLSVLSCELSVVSFALPGRGTRRRESSPYRSGAQACARGVPQEQATRRRRKAKAIDPFFADFCPRAVASRGEEDCAACSNV